MLSSKVKPVLNSEGKKNRRLGKWLASLNKEQRELLSEYCLNQSQSDLALQFKAYEMVLRPALYTLADNDVIEAEKILIKIIGQVGIEGVTLHNFKRGEYYMKYIEEIKENIISEYTMRKAKDEKEKEIIESIWSKYPKVSRNAVKNVILEHKRNLKKKELGINDVEDAVNYIFDDKQEVKEEPKELIKNEDIKKDTVEEIKSKEKPKFKVLKKQVIVDVEGEHATYHVEDGALSFYANRDLVFSSEEDIEKYRKKQKEYYERCLRDADRISDEMLEVMNMYK